MEDLEEHHLPYHRDVLVGIMVEVPSDHRYFFPKESSDWRFVYATLAGSGSFQLLGEVIERVGPMASFPRSSNTLAIFEQIYRTVRRGRELDQVENSIRGEDRAGSGPGGRRGREHPGVRGT